MIFGIENTNKIDTQNTTLMKRRKPAIAPTILEGRKFSMMIFLKIRIFYVSGGEHKKKGFTSQENYSIIIKN
jgi:hypothetical protein